MTASHGAEPRLFAAPAALMMVFLPIPVHAGIR